MGENTMILHHYDASPYAEKIRLMFGAADMAWQSVSCPAQPPRPSVDPLTGGYRKIPVAQLGADIFCDTSLIAQEVAVLADRPLLAPPIASDVARELAAHAEGDIFFAAITSVPPLRLLATLVGNFGLSGTLKFIKDRSRMMQGATVKPLKGAAAGDAVRVFQQRLDEHLADNRYLAGDTLSYADLCVYHPLWLQQRVGNIKPPPQCTHLARWFADVEKLGNGRRHDIESSVAFAAARDREPRALPDDQLTDSRIGDQVSVAPADYGRNPVIGELVAVTADRLVIARRDTAFGTLHVHFPRQNYVVNKA